MTIAQEVQRMLSGNAHSSNAGKVTRTSNRRSTSGRGKEFLAGRELRNPQNDESLREQTNALRSMIGLPSVPNASSLLQVLHSHAPDPAHTAAKDVEAVRGKTSPTSAGEQKNGARYSRHEMLGVFRSMLHSGQKHEFSQVINIAMFPIDEVKTREKIRSSSFPDELSVDAHPNGVTLMLKNIPNKYTREQLVDEFRKQVGQTFDFVYLPIDFLTQCNIGYCFVNFRTPADAHEFVKKFHQIHTRDCLPGFNSNKTCVVTTAAVQGSKANMAKLAKQAPSIMSLLFERPDWQPVLFDEGGREYRDYAFLPPPTPPPICTDFDVIPPPPPIAGRELVCLSSSLPLVDVTSPKGQSIAHNARDSLIRLEVETQFGSLGDQEAAEGSEGIPVAKLLENSRIITSQTDAVESVRHSEVLEVVDSEVGSLIRKRGSTIE
eukprot:GEMP01020338.1.p1 GENE.GEMP01020338.1~~GEMP01020338.1.p1  ORF type:complete len:434 (+),score=96.34 GEMP01020338.1:157-1458(+)